MKIQKIGKFQEQLFHCVEVTLLKKHLSRQNCCQKKLLVRAVAKTQNELLFVHSVKIFEFLCPDQLQKFTQFINQYHQNLTKNDSICVEEKFYNFTHCLEEWKKSLVFHHNSCFLLLHHVCCIIFPRKKGLINGTMFTTIDVTIKYSILHYFQVLRPTHLSKAPLRS